MLKKHLQVYLDYDVFFFSNSSITLATEAHSIVITARKAKCIHYLYKSRDN